MSRQNDAAIARWEVEMPCGPAALAGTLSLPHKALGVVAFAHGSGSGRFSPRNQFVAKTLERAAVGTLLFDLLSESEASERENVFDIGLLAERLQGAIAWLKARHETCSLPLGLFGASTGAAAALLAAARQPQSVAAVVSRGGRPDLAEEALPRVEAPTLLIVGGDDEVVRQLNQAALRSLTCDKRLVVVPGATHLFAEPGALEAVAQAAADWFVRHLGAARRSAAGT